MRVAPPVQAMSCAAGPWLLLQQMLYGLGTFVFMYWCGSQLLSAGAVLALGSLSTALVVATCAGHGLRQPARRLAWDGVAWSLAAPQRDAQPGQLSLMLDLGGWMLVRFVPVAAESGRRWPQWLALSGRDTGPGWQAMRVALHCMPMRVAEPGVARRSWPAA